MAMILLFGIPGSGKSTIAQKIRDTSLLNCKIFSFDMMSNKQVWDEKSFGVQRKQNLDAVASHAEELQSSTVDSFPGYVVIDDIMYLRSMRRQVYVIARDNHLPIICVHVDTPLSTALERNSHRDESAYITTSTISRIYEDLEPPDAKHICDRYSIRMNGDSEDSISDGIAAILEQGYSLWQKLRQGLVEQTERPRRIGPAAEVSDCGSRVKELDQTLRNIVAHTMKHPCVRSCQPLSQILGPVLAAAKAIVLNNAHAHQQLNPADDDGLKSWIRARCEEFLSEAEEKMRISVATADGNISPETDLVFADAKLYVSSFI